MHRPRHAMALDTNRSTTGGAVRGGYARSRSWRARIRRREWVFGRPEAGKGVRTVRLRTSVRRAIIGPTLDTKPLAERDAALLGGPDRVAGSGLPTIRNGYQQRHGGPKLEDVYEAQRRCCSGSRPPYFRTGYWLDVPKSQGSSPPVTGLRSRSASSRSTFQLA